MSDVKMAEAQGDFTTSSSPDAAAGGIEGGASARPTGRYYIKTEHYVSCYPLMDHRMTCMTLPDNKAIVVDIRLRRGATSGDSLSIRHIGLAFARPIMGKYDFVHRTGST